ncbi:hypothetical protein [Cupriavidus basilensis]|uniref:hypothetical protein n=1 Tax=Cupriavidus basilensis TaxID=68895 RepID=UPI0039F6C99B
MKRPGLWPGRFAVVRVHRHRSDPSAKTRNDSPGRRSNTKRTGLAKALSYKPGGTCAAQKIYCVKGGEDANFRRFVLCYYH